MTTATGFLKAEDLRHLTNAARADGQEAWLQARGIPHKREGRQSQGSQGRARALLRQAPGPR